MRISGILGFVLLILGIGLTGLLQPVQASNCADALDGPGLGIHGAALYPRDLDPAQTFEALVQWVHDELIVKRGAPGLVVGISGTDSIVAFLASAKAFERAGKPNRVAGVHFGPSEDLLDENPAAASHLWFQEQVIPWLRRMAPKAQIVVDDSIDFRRDGLRWGALMDWSVIQDPATRVMRPAKEQFWVLGTRNATEEALFTYSNASRAASVQLLSHLWKSEILKISRYLGAPEIALDKSCDVDCACGRMRLPAQNIPEIDALLMVRQGVLSPEFVERTISPELRKQLEIFIDGQIGSGRFKGEIPYVPGPSAARLSQGFDLGPILAIRSALASGTVEPKALSRLVPEIIAKDQANVAADLTVAAVASRDKLLPELLALLGTPSLRPEQKRKMLGSLFVAPPKPLSPLHVNDLSRLGARLGRLAFRFPQWRFLTQRAGSEPSLFEQFGLKPLIRETDLRDPARGSGEPERDELGRGFVWQDSEWLIEFRRAYILVAKLSESAPAAILVRNSSHFFGRDRLVSAAYYSFKPMGAEELLALTSKSLESGAAFSRLPELLRGENSEPALDEKLKRLGGLLDALDRVELGFNRWLGGADAPSASIRVGPDHSSTPPKTGPLALARFFASQLEGRQAGTIPLYLARLEVGIPSWQPENAVPLTHEVLERLKDSLDPGSVFPPAKGSADRLVLLSGKNGDFP